MIVAISLAWPDGRVSGKAKELLGLGKGADGGLKMIGRRFREADGPIW